MKATTRLQYNMTVVANAFCKAHLDPNPATAIVATQLDQLVGKANSLVQLQRTSQVTSTAAVEEKTVLRESLGVHLASLIGIAKTAARTEAGVTVHLRLPRGRTNERAFIAFARVAVAEATARKELFLKLAMPDDLLETMTAELDEYDAAIIKQRTAIGTQVGAGVELVSVIQEAMAVLKHLDALHLLRFDNDPELAANWKSARNVAYPVIEATPPASGSKAA